MTSEQRKEFERLIKEHEIATVRLRNKVTAEVANEYADTRANLIAFVERLTNEDKPLFPQL